MSFKVRALALCMLVCGLAACGPQEPLPIGYLGGVSGRVADLGIAGRNGTQLAIELRNADGGINGRRIELLVEDDKQDAEVARQAVTRLLEKKVTAIVGPMTSTVAMAVVPQMNAAGVVMLSPTVTTNALTGKDDNFLRVTSATRDYARISAEHHYSVRGLRRVTAIHDTRNRAYTEDWLNDYRAAFAALGGQLAASLEFSSSDDLRFADLAQQLLASKPDGILILANSVDAAMLVQQLRKLDRQVALSGSEWAATERLIELAGKAAEGFSTSQFFDRQSQAPAYLAFRKAYVERFGAEPGFAGTNAFDAANVLLDALARQGPGQSLKSALLAKPHAGTQSAIVFDAYGDVVRPTFVTTVRNGQFMAVR